MNIPIRHHYNPQMILRNFTDANGELHCFSKASGKVFKSSPADVFVEKYLYTQRDEHGKKDMSVESELSRLIEGPVAPVVKKIVEMARIGRTPGLTQSEKRAWDGYFCCQLRRLPSVRESLPDAEIVLENLDRFEAEVRPLTSSERKKFENPELQRELTRNAWVKIVSQSYGELMDVLQRKGLGIGVIENCKKSFVMGDNPTIRVAPLGRTHLGFSEVQILLPISHDVVVTPGYLAGQEDLVVLSDTEWIRKINEAIFEQSNLIAARSQRLIESLSWVQAERCAIGSTSR